jgi:hypothetical protein
MKNALILSIIKEHVNEKELTVKEMFDFIKTSPVVNMTLHDFCLEILDLKDRPHPTVSVSVVKSKVKESKKKAKKWEAWTENIQNEILYVLEQNDSGLRNVTLQDYLKRLREYDPDITEYSLIQFCKDHGRRGWTNA